MIVNCLICVSASLPDEKSTLLRQAYEHIHQKLLSGELSAGRVISEARIADELDMSRTPVGEAIRQLANQGLVYQVPRFGTIVRAIDRQDLVELYELREALETFAAAQASRQIIGEQIARLGEFCNFMRYVGEKLRHSGTRVLKGDELSAFLANDMAFHMLIIHAAGNRRIVKIVEDTRTVSRIFHAHRADHTLGLVEEASRYHLRILEAMKQPSPETAREAMAEHIRTSKNYSLEQYDQWAATERTSSTEPSIPEDLRRHLDRRR